MRKGIFYMKIVFTTEEALSSIQKHVYSKQFLEQFDDLLSKSYIML